MVRAIMWLKSRCKAIYGLFYAIFGPDSEAEKAKDKEIEWERNQWGFPERGKDEDI